MHVNCRGNLSDLFPRLGRGESSRSHEHAAHPERLGVSVTLGGTTQGQQPTPCMSSGLSLADRLQHRPQQRKAPVASPLSRALQPCNQRLLQDSSPCLRAGATEQRKPQLQSSQGQRSARSNTSAEFCWVPPPPVSLWQAVVSVTGRGLNRSQSDQSKTGKRRRAYAGYQYHSSVVRPFHILFKVSLLSDMSIIILC